MNTSIWPGWRTVRKIGTGSFGTVYEIERDVFGEQEKAALKVITIPRNQNEVEELRSDGYDDESINIRYESCLKDIVHEYSLMAKMKGNSNTVYCDDIKYERNEDGIGWKIYIKMELLTPLMKDLPAVSDERRILKLAHDICSALVMCRRFNIVHRDIKPQNIFIAKDGTFKLGDFGIAKTSDRTTSGTVVGTFKYMAPEVFNNRPYGSSADIYSLGMVLYWLLNERRTPFLPLPPKVPTAAMEDEARRRRFLGEAIPAPKNGSPALKEIVLKACAFDAIDRYGSAAEMLSAINQAAKAFTTTPDTPSTVLLNERTEQDQDDLTDIALSETEIDPKLLETVLLTAADNESEASTVTLIQSEPGIAPEESLNDSQGMGKPIRKTKKGFLFFHMGEKADQIGSDQPAANAQDGKSRKKKAGIIAAAVGLLAVIAGAVILFSGSNDIQADWTDWADTLPEKVTEEKYTIEERTVYSTRQLEKTQSTKSDQMDGWELYDTAEGNGDFGAWSAWSEEKPAAAEAREVEEQLRYRYSEKETADGDSDSMPGWTLEGTETEWDEYGAWSTWSQSAVAGSESREVQTQTKYRYRTKETTTSSSSSLSGWTPDGSTTTGGEWGPWSGWTDTNPGSPNSTREVKTKTQYSYQDRSYSSPEYGGWEYSDTPVYASDSIDVSAENPVEIDGKLQYKYRRMYRKEIWSDWSAYSDTPVSASDSRHVRTKVVYNYRTKGQGTTTYKYYRWTAWSDWSTTPVSQTGTREVQTQTYYRYRDRTGTPVYRFYRWKDWSAWSETEVTRTDDRRVETTTFYRFRDRVNETTYYFRRWTDWSEYREEPAEAREDLEVQTKTQYRYRSKESGGETT